jgi:LIM domain-containing protein 2
VRALDRSWHKECFVCSSCNKTLISSGFSKTDSNQPICADCHDNLFGMKCAGCNQAIRSNYISMGGKNYHKDCFTCESCGKPFGGKVAKTPDGRYLCTACIAQV